MKAIQNASLDYFIIDNFLNYVSKCSKHNIEEISKIINREKRKKYPQRNNVKYGDLSKAISEENFEKCINVLESEDVILILKLMFYMGLRVSEATKIRKEDISEDWLLTINNIKCKRKEIMPIPKSIRIDVQNFFNKNDKLERSKDYVRNKFRKASLKCKINRVYGESNEKNPRKLYLYSTHSLRHSFARRIYIKTGKDIEQTRISLRHKDIQMTERYIRDKPEKVWKIIEDL